MGFMEKIFGTHSERELKLINKTIDKIEGLRPQMQQLSDEELRADYIIPAPFDKRVAPTVAKAVKEAAIRTGVNRI